MGVLATFIECEGKCLVGPLVGVLLLKLEAAPFTTRPAPMGSSLSSFFLLAVARSLPLTPLETITSQGG